MELASLGSIEEEDYVLRPLPRGDVFANIRREEHGIRGWLERPNRTDNPVPWQLNGSGI
jgi:hypothetical protein